MITSNNIQIGLWFINESALQIIKNILPKVTNEISSKQLSIEYASEHI